MKLHHQADQILSIIQKINSLTEVRLMKKASRAATFIRQSGAVYPSVCVCVRINWQLENNWGHQWFNEAITHKWVRFERGPAMRTIELNKESPVLVMYCVHGVRAKLSILKSGQDRLTLQASLSHCESVKGPDNRQTEAANWQPGSEAERQTNIRHESRRKRTAGQQETFVGQADNKQIQSQHTNHCKATAPSTNNKRLWEL